MVIKLLVEPGEHPCSWTIEGHEVAGLIQLSTDSEIVGHAFEVPGQWSPLEHGKNKSGEAVESWQEWAPKNLHSPTIHGRLRNGYDIVLIDTDIQHFTPEQTRLLPRLAICGFALNGSSLKFETLSFQVGGLTELSGVTALKATRSPQRLNEEDPKFEAYWNKKSSQTWHVGDDTVELHYRATARTFDPYHFYIETAPVITVTGKPRSIPEWMSSYVYPVREISTFSSVKAQSISWVSFGRSVEVLGRSHQYEAQLFSSTITQTPYIAEKPEHHRISLVQLGESGANLASLLTDWRSLLVNHETFFDLYTAMSRDRLSIRAAFLTLVPALESAHADKYGSGQKTVEEHRDHCKDVFSRVKAHEVEGDDLKWLKRWIDKRGGYSLEERLRMLVEDLPAELRAKIEAKINPIPEAIQKLVPEGQNVWQIIGRIRNDLAHGGPHHSNKEIQPLLHIAWTVATGFLLHELGLAETSLTDAIDSEDWRVY